jgi:hypothetical protein
VCEGVNVLRKMERVTYPWIGEIRVTQSWTKMLIHLRTDASSSTSVAASVSHVPGIGYRLLYNYASDPKADQAELEKHDGSAEIMFAEDCISGEGCYFTDMHRSTVGTMKLRKV